MTRFVRCYNIFHDFILFQIIGTCGERYLTETKFDGERIMVHKSRNIYKFYSRNGIDYSEKLGRDSSRHFAARIDSVFKEHVESCLLDGELLVWDRKLERLGELLIFCRESAKVIHFDISNNLFFSWKK